MGNIHPSRCGSVLRPTPNIDDEKRWKRASVFIMALALVCALVIGAAAYYALNPGTKSTTVKDVTRAKTDQLFQRAADDDIYELECKCKKPYVERHPQFLDMTWDEESSCSEESAVFQRCVAAVPAAKTAQDLCADNCACFDPDSQPQEAWYSLGMCGKFAKILIGRYKSIRTKHRILMGEFEWQETAINDYREECYTVLYEQADLIETLGGNLDLVPSIDTDSFYDVALSAYASNIEEKDAEVCLEPVWDDDLEDFVDGELGPLMNIEAEVQNLAKYYDHVPTDDDPIEGHWQQCMPSSCSYVEDEGYMDFGLKAMALFSPIFSGVMAVAAILYSTLDNHWEDRENLIEHIDGLRRKSGAGLEKLGDNSL